MSLHISESIASELPATVRHGLGKMSAEQQGIFEETYRDKRKTPLLLLLLAIFLPIQHFMEGRIGMGLLFWLTMGGLIVWYVIDIFLVYGRIKRRNHDLATTIIRDLKILDS